MSCVNPNDPLFKILLKSIKNPLLAEIEFDTQQDYKPGVEEVFKANPKLSFIGNEEQYSQYLDTIFPDSQVKDIVYHLGAENIESFKNRSEREYELFGKKGKIILNGIYFGGINNKDTINPRFDESKKKYAVVLNIKNYELKKKKYTAGISDEKLNIYIKQGLDGVISDEEDTTTKEYVVFEPEQIHILGSKKDIEGFKKFVGKEEKITDNIQIDSELNSYITDQVIKNFGISIPNKNNETLISQGDVDRFNNDVSFNKGVLPTNYYTGLGNVHKWNINEKNLYDLVDKDTDEIYLRDVNLSKGVIENAEETYTPIDEEERTNMIDSINEAITDYKLDEILAEKGYDVEDFISNLEAASSQEELNKIINKILKKIC